MDELLNEVADIINERPANVLAKLSDPDWDEPEDWMIEVDEEIIDAWDDLNEAGKLAVVILANKVSDVKFDLDMQGSCLDDD